MCSDPEVEHVDTPIGEPCEYCTRKIEAADQGLLIPCMYLEPFRPIPDHTTYHIDCFTNMIRGIGPVDS